MSPTVAAWQQLYAAQTFATGQQLVATINGGQYQVIASEMTLDEILTAGGSAQDGGFNLSTLAANFPQGTDLKFAEVTYAGETLQVLNSNVNNGVVYLKAGDFTAHE